MENDEKRNEILLKSDDSELKIVEFSIGTALHAINIAKVREIIKADIAIVPVPDSHSSIEGAVNLRGRIIPVVNLVKHLGQDIKFDAKLNRIIISEFSNIIVGFLVTSVANIHQLPWKNVEKPSEFFQTDLNYTAGVIKIGEKVLFLLDFEKIAAHINPKAGFIHDNQAPQSAKLDRTTKKIIVAEDSDFTRTLLVAHLKEAGYQIFEAANGEEAWAFIEQAVRSPDFKSILDHYHLLITDIEMPQMDGLHLIKKIKDDSQTKQLPCFTFSSMISPSLIQKCKQAGSDGEISKPDIKILVKLADEKITQNEDFFSSKDQK